jgi:hypothetical protein
VITLPASTNPKPTNLRALPAHIYPLLLRFAQQHWSAISVVDDFTVVKGDEIPLVASRCARSLPFIVKDGIRFGCSTAKRTQDDQDACADLECGRVPCKIRYHFELAVGNEAPVICSVIERWFADENIPTMPWDLQYVATAS